MDTVFDPADFPGYRFTPKGVFNRRYRRDVPLTPQTTQEGYEYYYLTREDGVRVKVSAGLATGRVTKVGPWYMLDHFPKGWSALPGFPCYIINHQTRKVRRVGWRTPRTKPVTLRPTRGGTYSLMDSDGDYRTVRAEDLFA